MGFHIDDLIIPLSLNYCCFCDSSNLYKSIFFKGNRLMSSTIEDTCSIGYWQLIIIFHILYRDFRIFMVITILLISVIGGWGNTQSVIRLCKQCHNQVTVATPNILSTEEDREFYVSFEGTYFDVLDYKTTLSIW